MGARQHHQKRYSPGNWTMKGARAVFVIKVSVDDDMLYHLLDVKTPKEEWDIFSSMFAKKLKSIEDTVCYQCGKPGHIARDSKVKMVAVERNLAAKDSRQGEANKCGGAIEDDVWA